VTTYPLDANGLGEGVLLDTNGLDDVASSSGFASLALSAAGTTNAEQLVAAITPLIDEGVVQLSIYGYPQTPDEVANASSLRPVAWALAAFLGAIAIAGVGHGIHTTVRRRRGDVAVLRALGFRPADVRTTASWHGACVAAFAVAVGLPLGVLAGRLAFRALTDGVGLEGGYVVSFVGLGSAAAIALVATLLLAIVPGTRAARVPLAEVLRSE
jgi:cell division protein FtsX